MKKPRVEITAYLYILPAVVLVAIFAYYPAISAVYNSLFDWSGGATKRFIGFDNYERAAHDPVLLSSFLTVGCLMLFNVIKLAPSILLAVLIHRLKNERWQFVYRALLVVPMIIPQLVTLFIWKFFFDPNLGILNWALDLTGVKSLLVWLDAHVLGWRIFLGDVPIGWLSEPKLILPSLFLWGFPWIGSIGVLIYLAGLQSIGTEIYEAADLDGIGPIRKFFLIELPLISGQIRLSLILLIIGTIQGYGFMLLLLGDAGGPAGRGMVPGLWMYNRAFVAGEFGYACAIGVMLFAVIAVFTYANERILKSKSPGPTR